MIVWGGGTPGLLDTGGRYDPAADSWMPTAVDSATPGARILHSAVWTGTEMIVWGGGDGQVPERSGARYDPASDSWIPMAVPSTEARFDHTAIWTGSAMIVWGGWLSPGVSLDSGALY